MCTVTYLPVSNDGFIVTSNRDEAPGRRAEEWRQQIMGSGEMVCYPRDPMKGGTWFCFSDHSRLACLLNGAYTPFDPDPSFTTSRGEIVLDYFRQRPSSLWMEQVNLRTVAPFTLLLIDQGGFRELIWDGREKEICTVPADKPRIWSSVTLYPPEIRKWREQLFSSWRREHPDPTQEAIMEFHTLGGNGDKDNDLVMNRQNIVKTLSITSAQVNPGKATIRHLNLDTGKSLSRNFSFQPAKRKS